MADFMTNDDGELLNARYDLSEIVKGGCMKKGHPCEIGGFTCKADQYDRIVRQSD